MILLITLLSFYPLHVFRTAHISIQLPLDCTPRPRSAFTAHAQARKGGADSDEEASSGTSTSSGDSRDSIVHLLLPFPSRIDQVTSFTAQNQAVAAAAHRLVLQLLPGALLSSEGLPNGAVPRVKVGPPSERDSCIEHCLLLSIM